MRTEQLQRIFHYVAMSFRHATIKKLANWVSVESKLASNNPDLTGLSPYLLFVDISYACNLKCPLCQMGRRETVQRENRMTLANYTKIISPVIDKLFQVFLYNWGEPFLNPAIYDIIRFNTDHNIATIVSSNLNMPVDASRLVESGCDYLIASADGATQEVYEKYRVGGSLQKVTNAIRMISDEKRKRNTRFPIIEWQCLVSRHNESTLDTIHDLAIEVGANIVRFANLNFYSVGDNPGIAKEWFPSDPRYESLVPQESSDSLKNRERKPCFWLWRSAIVNADGGLTPCCLYDVPSWANAIDSNIVDAWNSPLFREARERSLKNHAKTNSLICDRCTAPFIFKK
jgi:MoaA/NifB/PqqE/SkfB family radical SAM enzyme